jgi:RNA polymerase sigma-70 factor, ECF subfamily
MNFGDDEIEAWLAEIGQTESRALAQDAMAKIYNKYNPVIRRYLARNWPIDPASAEEVAQDALLEVWMNPQRFRGQSSFRTWIIAIARNKTIDRLRKQRPEDEPVDESLPADIPAIPDVLENEEILEALNFCLQDCSHLSQSQREVLFLTHVEDMTAAEIAKIVNCPENTVRTRLYHARLRIARCMAKRLGGDPRND